MSARPLRIVPAGSDEAAVEGFHPLIPDGWYEAKFTGHDTARLFNTPKVILHFEVVQAGDHIGTKLIRPYRARDVFNPLGSGGRFKIHARGELFFDIVRLLDLKIRPDRVSLHAFKSMLFRVRTRTVTKDHLHRPTPTEFNYSVVGEIARGE